MIVTIDEYQNIIQEEWYFDKIASSWRRGVIDELSFWENWIDNKGGQWADDFENRLTAKPVVKWLENLLPTSNNNEEDIIKIIDVGSGPISKIGNFIEGKNVSIYATDLLADFYNKRLALNNIKPIVPVCFSYSEFLNNVFPKNNFDLVTCNDTIDETYSPIHSLIEMVKICRIGGVIFISSKHNNAERCDYIGNHIWNIGRIKNDFILWNTTFHINISSLFKDIAEIIVTNNDENVEVIIRKKTDLPNSFKELNLQKDLIFNRLMLKILIA